MLMDEYDAHITSGEHPGGVSKAPKWTRAGRESTGTGGQTGEA